MNQRVLVMVCIVVSAVLTAQPAVAKPKAKTVKVSHAVDGSGVNNNAYDPYISRDGKVVAFRSPASNLVSGDSSGHQDTTYVVKSKGGTITRIGQNAAGELANGYTTVKDISKNGRYVLMTSAASNLLAADPDSTYDVYVADTKKHTLDLASLRSDGAKSTGTNYAHALSGDGRFVLFSSDAKGIVPTDNNTFTDVFLRDRKLGSTEIVSSTRPGLATDNCYANDRSISGKDGRYLLFECEHSAQGSSGESIFLRDRIAATTELVSVATDGSQITHYTDPAYLSGDARYIVFNTDQALDAIDTDQRQQPYIRDRKKHTTALAVTGLNGALPDAEVIAYGMTSDGRYLSIVSPATNLTSAGNPNGTYQIYRYDVKKHKASLLSQTTSGGVGVGVSDQGAIADDGRAVVFESLSNDLVKVDDNGHYDVFVRTLPK